jgi:hypothetical protein
MLGHDCNIDRPIEDFLGKPECFKCGYAKKLKELKTKKRCKICKTLIQKGRWKFCSKECAKEGKNIQDREYWTSNLKGEKNKWKEFRF